MSDCPYCRRFREQLEEAEETIRALKASAVPEISLPPRFWKLTGMERALLSALLSGRVMRKAALLDAMETDAEIKIVDVFLCKLRRKLAPFGVRIITHWGVGYQLSPEHVEAVKAAFAGGAHVIGLPVATPAGQRSIPPSASAMAKLLAEFLQQRPGATLSECGAALGVQPQYARKHLHKLLDQGLVEARGRKPIVWRLAA